MHGALGDVRRSRRGGVRSAFLAAVVAVFAAACTGGDDGSPTPEVMEVPAGTAVATSSAAPEATTSLTPGATSSVTPEAGGTVVLEPIGVASVGPALGAAGSGGLGDAVGPLVVYQRAVSGDRTDTTRVAILEVVTVDLGRGGAEVARFEVGSVPAPQIRVAGDRVFVGFARELRSYAVDGSDGVVLRRAPEGMVERFAAVPDGSLIAINEFTRWDCADLSVGCSSIGEDNRILVIDAESGEVVLEVAQSDPGFAEFVGVAGPSGWSADGATLGIGSYTYSESGGSSARLELDGTLTLVEDPGRFLGETIELVPAGGLGSGLGPFSGWTQVRVLDVVTGAELNAFDAGAPLIDLLRISPDGTEVLLGVAQASEELAAVLRDAAARGERVSSLMLSEVDDSPRRLVVLGADGSRREVGSLLEAHERWYAGRVVSFVCDGVETAGVPVAEQWWPGGGTYGVSSGCGKQPELRVNGVALGGGNGLRVLGFVEVGSAAAG